MAILFWPYHLVYQRVIETVPITRGFDSVAIREVCIQKGLPRRVQKNLLKFSWGVTWTRISLNPILLTKLWGMWPLKPSGISILPMRRLGRALCVVPACGAPALVLDPTEAIWGPCVNSSKLMLLVKLLTWLVGWKIENVTFHPISKQKVRWDGSSSNTSRQ